MVQGASTTTAFATVGSWLVLAFVGLIRAAGASMPRLAALVWGLVAAPIALAAALHALAAMWRGPTVVAFARSDAVPCTPAEATFIRRSSQLHGTMGGAGYLHPGRLLLPTLAWLAAAVVGVAVLSDAVDDVVGPWGVAVMLLAGAAALMLPARPYFYLETTGGGAWLSPPSAAFQLRHRAEAAQAVALGVAPPAPPPTPTPTPTGLTPSSAAPREPRG